jgi:hypothetical protein
VKAFEDFGIARGGEIPVPQSDGLKILRALQTYHLVHKALQGLGARARTDRRREDDLPWLLPAESLDCSARRGAGRETVVNQNYGAASDVERRSIPAIDLLSALQLRQLASNHPLDHGSRNTQASQESLVQHGCARRNSPHGDLFRPRNAQLADDQNIQVAS